MLHNTGPYGPQDVPVNLGTPLIKPELSAIDMSHNLGNISKLSHEDPQSMMSTFNNSNYTAFSHHPLNSGTQMNPFSNFSSHIAIPNFNNGSGFYSVPNGLVPFNMSDTPNSESFYRNDFPNNILNQPINTDVKPHHGNSTKTQLNIPQIQTKMMQKQINMSQESEDLLGESSSFYSINKSLDDEDLESTNFNYLNVQRNLKKSEKDLRTERIENAVKHIEHIIATDMLNKKKELEQRHGNSDNTLIESDNNTNSFNDSDDSSDEQEQTDDVKHNYESDSISDEDSEMNNRLKGEVKQGEKRVNLDPSIMIKTENISHVEVEIEDISVSVFDSPFLKDCNGITKDSVDEAVIIGAESSVEEAQNNVKNGLSAPVTFYECPHCSLLFNHTKRFLIHAKWHTFGLTNLKRQEEANAKEMKKAMKRSEELAKRGSTMEGMDDLQPCKDCDKVFITKTQLKNHRFRFHKSGKRTCVVCQTVVADWKALREHHAVAHIQGESGFNCHHCDKVFKHKHTLAKHTATHLEKKHACLQCPKKFGSEQLLKQHSKTHERAERGPKYHCSYCGKGYHETYNLQIHERTHRNERPFQCEICNSNFGTNSSLKRHLKVSHSSTKPHVCSICHRSFTTQGIRDRHEQRVHGDESAFKYKCKSCPCKYMKAKDLKKHMHKAHPKSKWKSDESEED